MKRFELRIGKFGYYYYDTTIQIDMTLEMVINKLNYYEVILNKEKEINRKLNMEIIALNRKLIMINEVKSK